MPWYGSHTYLNEHIRKHHCRRILEIGVYTGENAVSMVKTAIEHVSDCRRQGNGMSPRGQCSG